MFNRVDIHSLRTSCEILLISIYTKHANTNVHERVLYFDWLILKRIIIKLS
jgi:hypothetical protein